MVHAILPRPIGPLLRAAIVLLGAAVLAFLLVGPSFEGRNAGATFYYTYFTDPLLAYAYAASVPFFVALGHAFTLLGPDVPADSAARALRSIRTCALVTIPLVAVGVIWLLLVESDDRPPIIMMGTIVTIACIAVAALSHRATGRFAGPKR